MKQFLYLMALSTIFIFTACGNSDDVEVDDEVYTGRTITLSYSDYTTYGYFDGLLYYEHGSVINTLTVSKALKSAVTVEIPSVVIIDGDKYICFAIGDSAFEDCAKLTSVTIPNSVYYIYDSAFRNCSGLTSITIPNSVTGIGHHAFWGCSGLPSIDIPNSVDGIGWNTFRDCSGLTSIDIPNSVTYIAELAFAYCSGLSSVTLGNSVRHIGDRAFIGCPNLTKLTSLNLIPPEIEYSEYSTTFTNRTFTDEQYETLNVYVPKEALEEYQYVDGWKQFKNLQGI